MGTTRRRPPSRDPSGAHGDVGNWAEPLGIASLWIEGCVVALSGAVLAARATVARRMPVVGGTRIAPVA